MMQNPYSVTHVTNMEISHFNVRCEKRRIQQRNISGRSGVRCANVHLIIHSSVEKIKTVQSMLQRINQQMHNQIHLPSKCLSVRVLVRTVYWLFVVLQPILSLTNQSLYVLNKISNPLVTVLNWQMDLDQPDLCKVEVQPKSGCRV